MEADWSVEIGADLPVIAVPWEGFVDLRADSSGSKDIPEAIANPFLFEGLIRLNAGESSVFSSKCDAWPLTADEIDPFEFDTSGQEVRMGMACYIDVITRAEGLFESFEAHENWVRTAILTLRKFVLRQSRADFVVRRSFVDEREGFAITLYVAACAENEKDVQAIFQTALNHAITVTIEASTTTVGE